MDIKRRIFVLTADDGAILEHLHYLEQAVGGVAHHPGLAVGIDEVGAVLDAELIPKLDAVATAQVDVGAAFVLGHDAGGDGGAGELGDDVLGRLLQLVAHLLAVAGLPELAAVAAHQLPLGEGPVGPALILLAPEQAAVDAVEQVELHAEVADRVLIPAGQLIALGLEGEIVDAAEHQILAVGAQAQGLDLLEGAAIPLLQVERVYAQVLVQPLAGDHPLGRRRQGLEQAAGEIRRHVVEGAGARLIRVAHAQAYQRQILGVVLGLADLALGLDVGHQRDVHAAVAHLLALEAVLADVAAGADLDLLRTQAAVLQALDAGDGGAAGQQGLTQRIPGRLLAGIDLVAPQDGGTALRLYELGAGRQTGQQQG